MSSKKYLVKFPGQEKSFEYSRQELEKQFGEQDTTKKIRKYTFGSYV